MKTLTPTPVVSSALLDVDFLTDLVQRIDRCVLRLAEVEGSILRLEAAHVSHVEAHGLARGAGASLGALGATHPVVVTTTPPATPPEVEVLPEGIKASALLVKIAHREGCTVESVRAMLSGKTERLPNGRRGRSAPRGPQFAALRDASGEVGVALTANVHMLQQLVRPHGQYPTLYGAIRSGRRVRIT